MKAFIPWMLLSAVALWLLWGNRALEINEWSVCDERIPEPFRGFRIAQVSDLHNTPHWKDALKALDASEPDLIVMTGDLIDSRNTDVETALEFVRAALTIAPCCYVSGNHEASVAQWEALRVGLQEAGVAVLENDKLLLERDGSCLAVLGLTDPAFGGEMASALESLTAGEENYQILLSHRPERLELYARCGVDLVFSGHAHGGQVRLPFVGGLIAPHQGWLPEYDAGLYQLGGTTMLLSRGVGNSAAPLRINNRPEILVAVLDG